MYYVLQFATFAILVLAANTAYADFPRLGSIVARDGFLPRQLPTAATAWSSPTASSPSARWPALLIVIFGGDTSALIPLYASVASPGSPSPRAAWSCTTGAAASRVESSGRDQHHRRRHDRHRPARRRGLEVHDRRVGAGRGDPRCSCWCSRVGRHYDRVRRPPRRSRDWARRYTHTVVVLVGAVNRGVLQAVNTPARWHPTGGRLVHRGRRGGAAVLLDAGNARLQVELHTIYSPYRELTRGPRLPRRARRRDPTTSSRWSSPSSSRRGRRSCSTTSRPSSLKARLLFRPTRRPLHSRPRGDGPSHSLGDR